MTNITKNSHYFHEKLKKVINFEPFYQLLEMKKEKDRDVSMLSALVVMSATLPNYYGKLNGKYLSPHLYLFITGKSATGKAMTTNLIKPVVWDIDQELEVRYKQELREYGDMLATAKKGEKVGITPPKHRKILLAPNTTEAAFFKDLLACEEHGALLATAEADAIVSSMQSDFGRGLSEVMRCAFEHEFLIKTLSGSSSGELDTHYRIKNPRLAVLLAGTHGQLEKNDA